MKKDIVKAKLDIIFKKIFAAKSNEDLLHDFISSVLEIPYNSIKSIVVQNPEILPDMVTGKFCRLDIKLQVDDKLVNLEIQSKSQSFYKDRALFYWSKLYTEDLKSGEEFYKLKQSIAINIVNFNMFDCEEYHSVFKLKEDKRGELLSDKCAIHFFELKKINPKVNKDNKRELWLQLINAESEEELDMLNQTNVPEIQKAIVIIHEMSADEKVREAARLREKALHDEATALGCAKMEGAEEIVEKMRKSGMSDEDIAKVLSVEV